MGLEVAFVFVLLTAAIIAISLELVAIDVMALTLLVAVVATGILPVDVALSGFSSEAVIILGSLFVLAGTMTRAQLAEAVAEALMNAAGRGERSSLAIVMGVSAALSMLLSNTSTSSVLTPAVLQYAKRSGTSASRLLMPMAFASLMGGTMVLIGTSTNLSASGLISGLGMEPYAFFEFFVVGGIVTISGIAFMVLIGRYLIPDRRPLDLVEDYGMSGYLAVLKFGDDSESTRTQIEELDLAALDLEPLAVIRNNIRLAANPLRQLRRGDRLIVRGTVDGLLRVKDDKRFDIETDSECGKQGVRPDDACLGEAVVMPNSRLVGKLLGRTLFFRRRSLTVLAVHRKGRAFATKLGNLQLQAGDVLLLQGATEDLESLRGHPDLRGLAAVETPRPTLVQGLIAAGLLALSVVLSGVGLLPLSIALLASCLILIFSGIILAQDAYRMIDWRLLVMIASMTGFGLAIYETGAAGLVANLIVDWVAPFGVTASLLALGVVTVALTQPMSNAAAVLTMVPVAVSAAGTLGIDPRSAAVMVTLAGSLSFIAPLEPALMIVYGPGRYRFVDFIRVGGPLTLLTLGVLVYFVPLVWPLHPAAF
jgi:di/tricarboxylate transporter